MLLQMVMTRADCNETTTKIHEKIEKSALYRMTLLVHLVIIVGNTQSCKILAAFSILLQFLCYFADNSVLDVSK